MFQLGLNMILLATTLGGLFAFIILCYYVEEHYEIPMPVVMLCILFIGGFLLMVFGGLLSA